MLPRASRASFWYYCSPRFARRPRSPSDSSVRPRQKKPAVGQVAVKPKSLKFGKVTHIATLQFVIENSGTAPISGTIIGNGTTPFTIISGSSSFGPLDPGATYAVTVQFAPSKKGSYASALTIASDAKNAKVKVAVSGSARSLATPTPTLLFADANPHRPPRRHLLRRRQRRFRRHRWRWRVRSVALTRLTAHRSPHGRSALTGYGQGATALACVTTDAQR